MDIKRLNSLISRFLNSFLNFLNPRQLVGGLEIGDSDIKFILIKDNSLVSASLKLPMGVVESGKIKDKTALKTILNKLHSQIGSGFGKKDKICVIVNIPDTDIYTQIFNLPMLSPESIEEAARLNLQMISPIDFSGVHANWQKVSDVDTEGGQLEIFGAFAPRQFIDEFEECLREENFTVTAVEFSSLAVSRLTSGLGYLSDFFLLLNIGDNGLSFNLIKNYNLHFNHFIPWPAKEDRQISFDAVKEIIIEETQKVLNFANNHWPKSQLSDILLIAPSLEEKVSQVVKENFSLSVKKLVLPSTLTSSGEGWSITNSQLPSLSPNWLSVLGSAMRGLIPRQKDKIISLTDIAPLKEFQRQQIINFIRVWRNIVLISLVSIFIVFLTVEIFLMRTTGNLNEQLASMPNSPEIEEVAKLQNEAKNFNKDVELITGAAEGKVDWSLFLVKIRELARKEIIIKKIFIQSLNAPVFFSGQANSESAILNFKERLESEPGFKEVNLPLSEIKALPNGLIDFSISFKITIEALDNE